MRANGVSVGGALAACTIALPRLAEFFRPVEPRYCIYQSLPRMDVSKWSLPPALSFLPMPTGRVRCRRAEPRRAKRTVGVDQGPPVRARPPPPFGEWASGRAPSVPARARRRATLLPLRSDFSFVYDAMSGGA